MDCFLIVIWGMVLVLWFLMRRIVFKVSVKFVIIESILVDLFDVLSCWGFNEGVGNWWSFILYSKSCVVLFYFV